MKTFHKTAERFYNVAVYIVAVPMILLEYINNSFLDHIIMRVILIACLPITVVLSVPFWMLYVLFCWLDNSEIRNVL